MFHEIQQRRVFTRRIRISVLVAALLFSQTGRAALFSRPKTERPTLALLPVENLTGEEEFDLLLPEISRMMFQNLYDSGRFRLIEMEKIGEIVGGKFRKMEEFDREAYLDAVKKLGAELILFSNLREVRETRGKKKKKTRVRVKMDARLVRLLNGEILCMETREGASSRRDGRKPSRFDHLKALKKCLKKLCRTLARCPRP
jgi:hypothetical protein